MATLDEILRRLRIHGVPGAPAAAAVPGECPTDARAELRPIFAALAPHQRRAGNLLAAAEEEAAGRRAAAEQEAQRLVDAARAAAPAARAEAVRGRLARAEAERRQVEDGSRAEAERIARVADARMPGTTELVVNWVLALPDQWDLGR